ncbi:MAG: phosphoribosyl-ATP diphosphatase [Hyphomicrobiales bacterium]
MQYKPMMGGDISDEDLAVLARLATTIGQRRAAPVQNSYTARLLADPQLAVRKFGEEALEVVMAAMQADTNAVTLEAADLIYHLLVLCAARGVEFGEVLAELQRREGVSGLAEKAGRATATTSEKDLKWKVRTPTCRPIGCLPGMTGRRCGPTRR